MVRDEHRVGHSSTRGAGPVVRGPPASNLRRGGRCGASGPPPPSSTASAPTTPRPRRWSLTTAARFEVVAHDQQGPRPPSSAPARPYSMSRLRADASRGARPWAPPCRCSDGREPSAGYGRPGPGPSPGPSGSSGWRSCARRRAVRTPRRTRCTSSPTSRPTSGPPPCCTLTTRRFTPEWLAERAGDARWSSASAPAAASTRPTRPARRRRATRMPGAARDVTDRLGVIACPTLVAWGRYDGFAPPANGEVHRRPGAERRAAAGRGRHALWPGP